MAIDMLDKISAPIWESEFGKDFRLDNGEVGQMMHAPRSGRYCRFFDHNRWFLQQSYAEFYHKLLSAYSLSRASSKKLHNRSRTSLFSMIALSFLTGLWVNGVKAQGESDTEDSNIDGSTVVQSTIDRPFMDEKHTPLPSDFQDRVFADESMVNQQSEALIDAQEFVLVAAGLYQIPAYLKRYFKNTEFNEVYIEQPFSIRAGEVSVGEFKEYIDTLDDVGRKSAGKLWREDLSGSAYSNDRPVDYVSFQDAMGYVKWLSSSEGGEISLPTLVQWAAAVILYGENEPVLSSDKSSPELSLRSRPDHLIGNLREWSTEACGDNKYLLLGEDYMSNKESLGELPCVINSGRWKGAGFRVVRVESSHYAVEQ